MSNPYNGSKNGLRGGAKNRPSRKPFSKESHNISSTQQAFEAGIYNIYASTDKEAENPIIVEETVETHLIPRKSVSKSQHLALFDRVVTDSIELKGKIAEKVDGKLTGRMIEFTEVKTIKLSDKTLLNQTKQFPESIVDGYGAVINPTQLKRQESRSKRIRHDEDTIFRNSPLLRKKKVDGVEME